MSSVTFIQEVVENKVQSGQSFTAYDVTLEVQEKLKTANLFDPGLHRHRNLKDQIHEQLRPFVTGGVYRRNLQDVGADVPAFVYHRDNVDPSNYIPQNRNSPVTQAQAPVAPANYSIPIPIAIAAPDSTTPTQANVGTMNSATTPQPLQINDEVRPGDARGTLAIPVRMLKDIGLNIGDKASVYVSETTNGEKILGVTKELPANTDELTTYTVDHAGNVRITKAVLKILDANATQYKLQCDKNAVLVKV